VRHPCGRTRRAERYGSSPVRRFRISVLVVATLRRQEIRRSYRIRDCDERHERVATQDTRERAGTMLAGQCHPTRKALRPCPSNRVASAAGGAFLFRLYCLAVAAACGHQINLIPTAAQGLSQTRSKAEADGADNATFVAQTTQCPLLWDSRTKAARLFPAPISQRSLRVWPIIQTPALAADCTSL
jgi:hypothetical protein